MGRNASRVDAMHAKSSITSTSTVRHGGLSTSTERLQSRWKVANERVVQSRDQPSTLAPSDAFERATVQAKRSQGYNQAVYRTPKTASSVVADPLVLRERQQSCRTLKASPT